MCRSLIQLMCRARGTEMGRRAQAKSVVAGFGELLALAGNAVSELRTVDDDRLVPRPLQQLASGSRLLLFGQQLVVGFPLLVLGERGHSQRLIFDCSLQVE